MIQKRCHFNTRDFCRKKVEKQKAQAKRGRHGPTHNKQPFRQLQVLESVSDAQLHFKGSEGVEAERVVIVGVILVICIIERYNKGMSVSSSTVGGGRTKYKIIFLGDQSVGKSSII